MRFAVTSAMPNLPIRFGGRQNNRQASQADKPHCASMPPSRPESPKPSSYRESLETLLRKKDHWANEVETHTGSAEAHLQKSLMLDDPSEDILERRHLNYVEKCKTWHDQVIGALRKKLNMPAVSSPLNPYRRLSPDG